MGQSCVRLDPDRPIRGRMKALADADKSVDSLPAIGADYVGSPSCEFASRTLRRDPGERPVLSSARIKYHANYRRKPGGLGSVQGDGGLAQVAHRLNDDGIGGRIG